MQNTETLKNGTAPRMDTKKMTVLAVMTALAYIATVFIKVPVPLPGVNFLKYEPKDVIITIGGFTFGPLASLIMSVVVSLIEMITISETGPIGALMNFISTCAFACTASVIYKRFHTIKGAVASLSIGTIVMAVLMLAWNYLITPLYMGFPREAVAALLLPAFLPFNLIKAVLNSAITMIIYKPLSNIMKKTHLLPENTSEKTESGMKKYAFVYIIAAFIIITCVAVIILRNMQA